MSKLIEITQDQFDKATALLQKDSNGYFLELSVSTDRSEKYETALWFVNFSNEILNICNILNINISDVGHFQYDFDESDHETVTKKLYFLTHSEFKAGYIYSKNEVVVEYDPMEFIAVIANKNNPDQTRKINSFNRNAYNYIIIE